MTQRTATLERRYVEAWKDAIAAAPPDVPAELRALRESAIAKFAEVGFPTARRGNEAWKYTDVAPIANADFDDLAPAPPVRVATEALDRHIMGGSVWNRMVFVDGHWVPSLTSLPSLPPQVTVTSLAKAMALHPHLVRDLGRYAPYDESGFTALNTAFLRDGAVVVVPHDTVVEEPIHFIYLSSSEGRSSVTQPRTLVSMGRNAKASVIESYGGLTDSPSLTNAVSEYVLDEGAHLDAWRLQQHAAAAYHVGSAQVRLGRNSRFTAGAFDFGGAIARHTLSVALEGEGSECVLYGLYMTNGGQHVDNQVLVEHVAPHTTSEQVYKGVLDGKSRGVFHGSITVRQTAQKTNAKQSDRNLLLSDEAEVDTKPALWIYADDVRCGHGAACGKLDDGALFYLQSRGIDEASARRMLVHGFANEVLEHVGLTPLRVHLEQLIHESLRHAVHPLRVPSGQAPISLRADGGEPGRRA